MLIDWVSDLQASLLIVEWFIIIFVFIIAVIAWLAYKLMEWWDL